MIMKQDGHHVTHDCIMWQRSKVLAESLLAQAIMMPDPDPTV